MAEMCALKAVALLAQGLPHAVADGADPEARAQVSLGAVLAGCAMRSCSAHALEHALSGHHPSPFLTEPVCWLWPCPTTSTSPTAMPVTTPLQS